MTTYGADDEVNQSGLKKGDFTCGGWYDTTAATGPAAVLEPLVGGANVTIVRQPQGTGAGKPQQSFSATVDEYVETSPANDYVTWTASFTRSGPIDDTPQS
jgi:hypothetical protein